MLQTVGNNRAELPYKKLAFKTPRYKSIERSSEEVEA